MAPQFETLKAKAVAWFWNTKEAVVEKVTAHPKSRGLTYGEHCTQALVYFWHSTTVSCALAVHAFLPNLCQEYASKKVKKLNYMMEKQTVLLPDTPMVDMSTTTTEDVVSASCYSRKKHQNDE